MQAITCPFNTNACGTAAGSSAITLTTANQTKTITTVPKVFTSTSMCYYKIQMQNSTLDNQNYTYDVEVVFT